jgi:MFS family permease
MGVSGSAWVLTGYSVTFGGLLLLFGRLGDVYGRLRMFRLGVLLFGIASLGAAIAWHPGVLVAARLAQGVGAAAFVPASLALLNAAAPDAQARTRAVGWYGAAASVGFVVGMLGGGVLTELAGWRSVFVVVLPVVAVMLVGSRILEETARPSSPPALDAAGALLTTAGSGLVIYALAVVPERGWTSPIVLVTAATGLLCVAVLPRIESRAAAPLFPRFLRSNPRLPFAYGAIALQSMVGISWLFLLAAYFQDLRGHGALASGLLFTPMTLAGLASALLAGRLVHRYGARRVAVLGLAVVGLGTALMVVATRVDGVLVMVMASVVAEAGFLMSNVALTVAGTDHPEADLEGVLSGVLNAAIQLGTGVGLAVVASVTGALLDDGLVRALGGGFLVCLVAAVGAILLASRVRAEAGLSRDDRLQDADPSS